MGKGRRIGNRAPAPGTAKGFLFITLEDETGISNVIVTPDMFQANRTYSIAPRC